MAKSDLGSILRQEGARRVVRAAAKSLGKKGPGGRVAAVLAIAVLAAVAWAGSQAVTSGEGELSGANAVIGAKAQSSPASEGSFVVSDAARAAAAEDAARSTAEQAARLDPATFDQVTVRHVVDGDTLAVTMPDGEHVSVRLIGIDTPESVAPQEERNCEEGVLASDHMKSLVTEGDTLWLQYDTSRTDRYGRPLAYVWRALPAHAQEADDPAFIARNMLNAVQVIDGYGQAKTYRPDTYHDGLFAQWGAEALAEGRGVTHKWA